ncbi:MAG: Smr/MutS family protein [Deltaproteobacteria bacterium]|nr:Smr/MutS family protein [Deltaproteobacteria bacterium]
MNAKLLEKLEWPLLLKHLVSYCKTKEGQNKASALLPDKKRAEVEERWELVESLRQLVQQGYSPPLGELPEIAKIVRAASIGQILDGEQLKVILLLLEMTNRCFIFAKDFKDNFSSLAFVQSKLRPLPELVKTIGRTIDESGFVRDDATPELLEIRRAKRSLTRKIEQHLEHLSQDTEYAKYLQDDFFTIRDERYVVPIRVDGRGRVAGSIVSTSASGQTLYIEPAGIGAYNASLKELELSEKLEIYKIFRELSQLVKTVLSEIVLNYNELVSLDLLMAEAHLAHNLDASAVTLSDKPTIKLRDMKHPLLSLAGDQVVANGVELLAGQKMLVISGPNAGGKTVILKTVGMLHVMAKAGLMLPASPASEMFLFDNVFIEMGDTQDISAHLSTFSGHLNGLRPIVEKAAPSDLVLLDELCVGTEPHTGAALGQSILEHLAASRAWVLVTTHFDALKLFALNQSFCRSGAMGYTSDYHPTYRLSFDVPGLSFGLEVAERVGLPRSLLQRARELKGQESSSIDNAIAQLMTQVEKHRQISDVMEKKVAQAEAEKARWLQEVDLLQKRRHDLAESLIEQYEEVFREQRNKFEASFKKAKQSPAQQEEAKGEMKEALSKLRDDLGKLEDTYILKEKAPGTPVVFDKLRKGDQVYVSRFRKFGRVLNRGKTPDDQVEVEIGMLKFKVRLTELRLWDQKDAKKVQLAKKESRKFQSSEEVRPTVIASSTNSLDLRGLTVEEALEKSWDFIDAAILRGEHAIILIHGHGTQTLKQAIRNALAHDCPYDVHFEAGSRELGGDGVTVVFFDT